MKRRNESEELAQWVNDSMTSQATMEENQSTEEAIIRKRN